MGFSGTFVILYIFWIVLSRRFDYFHLSLGIISCAIVVHASHGLLFGSKKAQKMDRQITRFVQYLRWHIYHILIAGSYVPYLVLHPRISTLIAPYHEFQKRLKEDLSPMTWDRSFRDGGHR
jgi:multicomponent Na+:H+ antiporter subunit E